MNRAYGEKPSAFTFFVVKNSHLYLFKDNSTYQINFIQVKKCTNLETRLSCQPAVLILSPFPGTGTDKKEKYLSSTQGSSSKKELQLTDLHMREQCAL